MKVTCKVCNGTGTRLQPKGTGCDIAWEPGPCSRCGGTGSQENTRVSIINNYDPTMDILLG